MIWRLWPFEMLWRVWCSWRHRAYWKEQQVVGNTHRAYICERCHQLWVWPR